MSSSRAEAVCCSNNLHSRRFSSLAAVVSREREERNWVSMRKKPPALNARRAVAIVLRNTFQNSFTAQLLLSSFYLEGSSR